MISAQLFFGPTTASAKQIWRGLQLSLRSNRLTERSELLIENLTELKRLENSYESTFPNSLRALLKL
jgi:hypothetical protein